MKCLTDVCDLPDKEYDAWFKRLREDRYEKLLTDWSWWRRDDQQPPAGDWHVWLLLAGRGFGKTRTGAEWVRAFAEARPGARIALVAASLHEARQVMVEGESGLLAIAPDARRPDYESSLRRLTWPNGAVATLYS
ncbi:MAG: DNA-packaging protein, partial [Sphingopyxis sp.]|nr:DNA-packaging protein [Sphingopyxis sp.]